jgi:hypothetical protein
LFLCQCALLLRMTKFAAATTMSIGGSAVLHGTRMSRITILIAAATTMGIGGSAVHHGKRMRRIAILAAAATTMSMGGSTGLNMMTTSDTSVASLSTVKNEAADAAMMIMSVVVLFLSLLCTVRFVMFVLNCWPFLTAFYVLQRLGHWQIVKERSP